MLSPYRLLSFLFPSLVWRIPTREKVIYLTFDDGPIHDVTPWVLETLATYNAKATFFCIGENVQKNTHIFNSIIAAGHATGNHTFNHLNALKVSPDQYLDNISKAEGFIYSSFFRPPYGKLKPGLIKSLKKKYDIIMWDVLSYDYDEAYTAENCFSTVKKMAHPGSIIVFHDSIKAFPRLKYALPKVLEYFSKEGYRFESINKKIISNGSI